MEPGDAGRVAFTMGADCNSWTGTWGYGASATGGGWTGTRLSSDVPAPSPSPTPGPSSPSGPVTQEVGPSGGTVAVGGGAAQDGGVSVAIPEGSLTSPTRVTLSVSNTAPPGVVASGAAVLPLTIDITTSSGASLAQTVKLRINLTEAQLQRRDINTIKGGVIVGSTFDPRPTAVLDAGQGTVEVMLDHFSKFSVITIQSAGPGSPFPPQGAFLDGFGATLGWSNPPGTTQFQLQVIPFNGDGPGVNIIRNAETSWFIPPPPQWYGLLPDITYFWRVRSTTVTTAPAETDWTAWGSWTFKTPKATSGTISATSPVPGSSVATRTPTVTWANSQVGVFYYEVQVSKDPAFNTDPATATAVVYTPLLHGGVTNPPNSYRIPDQFPLEPNTTYHWRVRPRIQGDGAPVGWTAPFRFATAN